MVRRYDAKVSVATGWGDSDSGMVTYAGGSGDDSANAITIDSSGNIYVAGYSNNGTDDDFIVRKYDANGDLATDWGDSDSGMVTYDGSKDDEAFGITLDSSNNIYVAGFSSTGSALDLIDI